MKTVAEYRAYAAVCRRLMARVSRPEDKQALETVARAWEHLADELLHSQSVATIGRLMARPPANRAM
jgi:hypothetical protein